VRGLVKSLGLAHTDADLDQVAALRRAVGCTWFVFDTDGSGEVDRAEFLRDGDGMADALAAAFNRSH